MKNNVVIICGPTASGKSQLALKLAQERDGVIINADAMQLYAELRILTARPSLAEEAALPHFLYGIIPAAQRASVGWWVEQAAAEIRNAWSEEKLPIVVGGTGLYLKCLMEGIAEIPPISKEARHRVKCAVATMTKGSLYTFLQSRDPQMAARLKPGDSQRIMRALEVWEETGKSLSRWQEQGKAPPLPEAQFEVQQTILPRNELYRRCDTRFLNMLEAGALEEVGSLMKQNLPDDLPAMRAVGVQEIMAYLKGAISRETMIAKAQQSTRNYAKRQVTWLKHQMKNSAISLVVA